MRERRNPSERHQTDEVPKDPTPPGRTTRVEAEYGRPVMRKAQRDDGVADAKDLPAAPRVPNLPSGGGAPLDSGIAASVERTTGASVAEARVHTGTLSAELAGALEARAFTVGDDIHLGAGESPTDAKLMTHEASHTIQQRGARGHAQTKLEVSQPGDALEREADGVAEAAAQGNRLPCRGALRRCSAKCPKKPPPSRRRRQSSFAPGWVSEMLSNYSMRGSTARPRRSR